MTNNDYANIPNGTVFMDEAGEEETMTKDEMLEALGSSFRMPKPEVRKYRFEAKMPPTRRRDTEAGHQDRAEALEESLNRPGQWSSEVVRSGKIVIWTMTIPDRVPLDLAMPIQDTVDLVGAICSDTIGPKSRKATLRYARGDEEFSGEIVCPGAW